MFDVHYWKYLTRIENTFIHSTHPLGQRLALDTRHETGRSENSNCNMWQIFQWVVTNFPFRRQKLCKRSAHRVCYSKLWPSRQVRTLCAKIQILLIGLLVNLHQRRCPGSSFDSGNIIKLLRCVLSALTLYYEHCVDRPISCHVWGSAASALLAVNSSVESDPNNNAVFERDFLAELTLAWTEDAKSLPLTAVPTSSFLINKEYHPFYYEPLVPSSQSICNK